MTSKRAILLLLIPISAFAQTPDYDAAIRDATERYRGDVPTKRDLSSKPLVVPTVEFDSTNTEVFGARQFSLENTVPDHPIPSR